MKEIIYMDTLYVFLTKTTSPLIACFKSRCVFNRVVLQKEVLLSIKPPR